MPTIKLQSEQLLIADFYASWLELKLAPEQKEFPSNIESLLLSALNKREQLLFEGKHIVLHF